MKTKPVAWMDEETGCFVYSQYDYDDLDEHGKDGLIPLYTHPVKDKPHPKCDEACMYLCRMRELTDEEIMEIVADKYEKGHGRYIDTKLFFVEFAKEILKKAQEK